MKKIAVVCHSGGMDSSICLREAIEKHGNENVLSMGFFYGQRNEQEIEAAEKICRDWGVERRCIDLSFLPDIAQNALTDHNMDITKSQGIASTLVVGRNGLFARLAAIQASSIGARFIYLGVMDGLDSDSGYRDCNRDYFSLLEKVLQLDLDDDQFRIETPLVHCTKKQSLEKAAKFGVLEYLLENTVTCYRGVKGTGCGHCPSCQIREKGVALFQTECVNDPV